MLAFFAAVRSSLNSVTLDGKNGGCRLPVKQLKGTDPVASIDLSRKGLGVLSAIVIGELMKSNISGSLTEVGARFVLAQPGCSEKKKKR